ncbi:MAG: fasciclin domain-containing protein [Actinomycetota bacterium]
MEDEAMEDEAMEDVGTIVDVASEAGSFTTLLAAAEAAGLVETLSGDGPLTVFAPTDDAFVTALDALGLTADELLADTDTLTSILTYHVVSGEVLSTDLSDGMTAATVNGAEITVDLSDGVKIDDANVVTPDVKASNGVIHIIDAVLLP